MHDVAHAYAGFVAAARSSVEHLHAAFGLDLWLVTCIDRIPRDEEVEPLLSGLPGWDVSRQVAVASAGPLAERVVEGAALPWSSSMCRAMVEESAPSIAGDIRAVPAYARLEEPVNALGLGEIRAYLGVPLTWDDGRVFGTVCAYGQEVVALGADVEPQLQFVADLLSRVLEAERTGHQRAQEVRRATELAAVDPLTGVCNRRGWAQAVEQEQARAARFGHPVSVLVADLDGLKTINDAHGHDHGDRAIVELASVLRRVCRPTDVVARLGGDEFAALVVEADLTAGQALVGRVREELERSSVNVSLGVATRRGRESLQGTLKRADAAMRADKILRGRLRT